MEGIGHASMWLYCWGTVWVQMIRFLMMSNRIGGGFECLNKCDSLGRLFNPRNGHQIEIPVDAAMNCQRIPVIFGDL